MANYFEIAQNAASDSNSSDRGSNFSAGYQPNHLVSECYSPENEIESLQEKILKLKMELRNEQAENCRLEHENDVLSKKSQNKYEKLSKKLKAVRNQNKNLRIERNELRIEWDELSKQNQELTSSTMASSGSYQYSNMGENISEDQQVHRSEAATQVDLSTVEGERGISWDYETAEHLNWD